MITLPGRKPTAAETAILERAGHVTLWRDWIAYLKAHLDLLAVEDIESDPRQLSQGQFENHADNPGTRRNVSSAVLKGIKPAQRAIYDTVREHRRSVVQAQLENEERQDGGRYRPHVDTSKVDKTTLEQLLQEARGGDTGVGKFPRSVDQWYSINTTTLDESPPAVEYSAKPSEKVGQRNLILIAALVLLAPIAMYMAWPASPAARAAKARPALTIDGIVPAVWQISEATGIEATGAVKVFSLVDEPSASWSDQGDETASGMWHSTSTYPVEICLPAGAVNNLSTLRLKGTGTTPERTYTLTSSAPSNPDVLVASCSASYGTWKHYGTLSNVAPIESFDQGDAVSLPDDQTVTLKSVRVIGPGEGFLTDGKFQVVLQVQAPKAFAWGSFNPTLTLRDGQAVLNQTPDKDGEYTRLTYSVAQWTGDVEASWTLTVPGTLESKRWRFQLQEPPTHEALIRQSLQVSAVDAQPTLSGESIMIQFKLHNTGSTPLLIKPTDVQLEQSSGRITIPDVAEMSKPLDPGEQRVVQLKVTSLRTDQEAILTVGVARFRIQF